MITLIVSFWGQSRGLLESPTAPTGILPQREPHCMKNLNSVSQSPMQTS
jgi:hypothetical protein